AAGLVDGEIARIVRPGLGVQQPELSGSLVIREYLQPAAFADFGVGAILRAHEDEEGHDYSCDQSGPCAASLESRPEPCSADVPSRAGENASPLPVGGSAQARGRQAGISVEDADLRPRKVRANAVDNH